MWRNRKAKVSTELGAKEMNAIVEAAQVSEEEIRRWHADFLNQYPTGRLDKKAFVEYYQKLHPNIGPPSSFETIFDTIDVNNDGTIDFNELLLVIVLMSRLNNLETRLDFVLHIWGESGDEQIDQAELADIISAIYDRAGISDRKGERDPERRAKEIINKLDISGNKKLSKQEFIAGCKNDPIIRNLFDPDT